MRYLYSRGSHCIFSRGMTLQEGVSSNKFRSEISKATTDISNLMDCQVGTGDFIFVYREEQWLLANILTVWRPVMKSYPALGKRALSQCGMIRFRAFEPQPDAADTFVGTYEFDHIGPAFVVSEANIKTTTKNGNVTTVVAGIKKPFKGC